MGEEVRGRRGDREKGRLGEWETKGLTENVSQCVSVISVSQW